jgi:hypothetical protein
MAQPYPTGNVQAHIEADVISGQVAIGNNILQVKMGDIHGGIVNIMLPEQQPGYLPRPTSALLLPSPFHDLLNRTSEIDAATSTLQSALPVQFHGPAGLGKTALLRHLAHHPLDARFPDGIGYYSVRQKPVDDLLQFFFDAFYDSDPGFKPTDHQIRQGLQDKQALILLDDVELPREEVEALMNAAPRCTFVLASQERSLWGEGRAVTLRGLPPSDALALVERGLGRSLTPEEQPAAQALCTALEGHPLDILQAVATAQEEDLSLADMAQRVQSAPSATELTELALKSLSEPAQRVVAALAALGGAPLTAEHLSALTELADVAPLLETLLSRGLVQAHSPRYSLAGRLQDLYRTVDLTPWAERTLAHFSDWAERHRSAPDHLLEESDAILQTLKWAVGAGRWRSILRLGWIVEGALALGKQWGAWAQVLQWMLHAAQALGDRAAQAWALHQGGTRALCLGDTSAARTSLIRALRLRESLGDRIGAAVTRHNLNILLGPPPPPRRPPQAPRTPSPAGPAAAGVPLLSKETVALVSALLVALGGLVLGTLLVLPRLTPTPTPTATAVATVAIVTAMPTPSFTATSTRAMTPTWIPTFTPTNTPTPTRCRPWPPSGWVPCTVKRGDTLYSLARQCGTTVQIVMRVNCLTGSKIVSGQRLWLPCCATPTPTFTTTWTPTPTSSPTPTPTPTSDLTPPPPPVLFNPRYDARIPCPADPVNVSFQWTSVTDPSGVQNYEVHLEAIEVTPHIYPQQFSTASALELSMPCFEWYRWRVRATDGAGNTGAWSNESLFSVAQFIITPTPTYTPTPDTDPPPDPTPIEPGTDPSAQPDIKSLCPRLYRWNSVKDPSGVVYYVTLEEKTFDKWTEVGSWGPLSDPELVVADPRCGHCASYRWHVRASDGAGNTSDWSTWLYYNAVCGV